jgi:chorismate mutase
MALKEEQEKLEAMRRELAQTDQMIVSLLNRRQMESHRIQMFKHSLGITKKDPLQEERVIQHIRKCNPGPMTCEAVEAIYRTIFERVVTEE